jgi:hypothetical protein
MYALSTSEILFRYLTYILIEIYRINLVKIVLEHAHYSKNLRIKPFTCKAEPR